ncbi:hypothetical protein ACFQ7W_00645 [Streptomyces niveus]|uniref:hypothetical protein n=1 Tax=Streptomyces niveus TaxID=193462 RepID=UPI0036B04EDB
MATSAQAYKGVLADVLKLREKAEDGPVADFLDAVTEYMAKSDDPVGVLEEVIDLVSGHQLRTLLITYTVRLSVVPDNEAVTEAVLLNLDGESVLFAPRQRLSTTLTQARTALGVVAP